MRDRDYPEILDLADKGATEAERLRYRLRARRLDPPEACAGYADVLKGFIRFMRYGVKSPSTENTLHEGLQAFREAALENYMEMAEYMKASGGGIEVGSKRVQGKQPLSGVGGFWHGIHIDFFGSQMAYEIVNVDMGVQP